MFVSTFVSLLKVQTASGGTRLWHRAIASGVYSFLPSGSRQVCVKERRIKCLADSSFLHSRTHDVQKV